MIVDIVLVIRKDRVALSYPVICPSGDPDELLRQFYAVRSQVNDSKEFYAVEAIGAFETDTSELIHGRVPCILWYSRFGDYRDYAGTYKERFDEAFRRFPCDDPDADCEVEE